MTAPSPLRINSKIEIPRSELRFTFVRSSGPGGQNVNKVATKALLRWDVARSPSISDPVRERFLSQNKRRVNDRGELLLASQRFRDQAKNVADCLDKLRTLVLAAAVEPRVRKKTRLPKAALEARLRQKRATAEKKQRRSRPKTEE
jgi:ribosome-associated protein